jgi:hypothetical protein
MKRIIKRALRQVKCWVDVGNKPVKASEIEEVPFDNSYEWLDVSFRRLMRDPLCARRPQYVWGMLQGAALAKVLGLERVSVIEFGVASGAGLVCMESIAENCEQMVKIGIDVFGFDTGTGYPKPQDYRDMPYRWFEGFYPCDKEALQKHLKRAQMIYGPISETLDPFMRSGHAPIAFVGWDLNEYSGTQDGLRLYSADSRTLLPRTPCSFRSIVGKDNCEYTGEAPAISEFNTLHEMRKICKIPGMKYFIPPRLVGHWVEMLCTLHIFDHPLYNRPQSYKLSAFVNIDGQELFAEARLGAKPEIAPSGLQSVRQNSQ